MDSESLKSVASLLVWGVLLFLMMRYGCGAHVMGGHKRHEPHGTDGEERDPVCGMTVRPDASSAAAAHQGKTYYFCSRSCRDKFEDQPGWYVGTAAREHHRA